VSAVPKPRRARRRRLARALVSPDSYGSILVLLLITYVASATATQQWQRSLIVVLQVLTVSLALRVAGARRVVLTIAAIALAYAIVVAIFGLFSSESDRTTGLLFIASAALYFLAPLSILRSIVLQQDVDQETVLGAIDAYLFLGMFFAYAYQAIGAFGDPFFQGGVEATVPRSLFFSFTTLTTTGYGNLVPAGQLGQTVAVGEMLLGPLFLVTAVAKVITVWRPARWRAAGGGEAPAPSPPGGLGAQAHDDSPAPDSDEPP
jgi:hypothetical protein